MRPEAMTPGSIPDYLDHWAGLQPDKCFSAFLDVHGRVRESYTYATFDRRSRSLAEHLSRGCGLRHGDRALLVYAPGLELVAAFVACVRIGVIPAVTPPPQSPESRSRLIRILLDCAPRAILTDRHSRGSLEALLGGPDAGAAGVRPAALDILETDRLRCHASPSHPETPNDILFLQYTSGSSGEPKGVVVSHGNVIHNCHATAHERPVGVSWLPQFHDMGMIGFYLFLIVTGGTTYGFSPADFLRRPVLWLETLSKYAGTITSSPNFGFEYCLSEKRLPERLLHGIDLSSVRVFMNGAEPVDPVTYRRFHERFAPYGLSDAAHAVGYGLAENTLAVSFGGGGRSLALDGRALQGGRVTPAADRNTPGTVEIMSCGPPLAGIEVRIVDPETGEEVPDGEIGEIWVSGPSKCQGYWNQPDLSRTTFANTLASEGGRGTRYLRTGDLGFAKGREIHVCGRIKDVVILRGKNYFAADLEAAILATCPGLRADRIAVFQEPEKAGALVAAIGGIGSADPPDLGAVVAALRTYGFDGPVRAVRVHHKAILRTSSGKLARGRLRDRWVSGDTPALECRHDPGTSDVPDGSSLETRYRRILEAYGLAGDERATLGELGLDSLAIVQLVMALEEAAEDVGAPTMKAALDGPLVQGLRVADLTGLVERLGRNDPGPMAGLRRILVAQGRKSAARHRSAMRSDAKLEIHNPAARAMRGEQRSVLLTGGTGFLGPFLLASLLAESDAAFHVLVRGTDPAAGRERLAQGLCDAGFQEPQVRLWLESRVEIVCGDLSRLRLGLSPARWAALSEEVDAIVHSGALVDYGLTYDAMKGANVEGTRELLRLAFEARRKRFHHVSSTIIFGWSARDLLLEAESNDAMAELDFGYAQTKWVAEQLVLGARRQGLDARIYRPSFVTASTGGVGDRSDIVIRILAFMINHRLAPRTVNQISFLPVDITAHNVARLVTSPRFENATFHVTIGGYYNLMDVTDVIARGYGVSFRYVEMGEFVRRMRALCTEHDPAYPLLDFVTRAHNKFGAMQHKRYCNAGYRRALETAGGARPDPDLSVTVAGLMEYMRKEGLIGSKHSPAGPERGVPRTLTDQPAVGGARHA